MNISPLLPFNPDVFMRPVTPQAPNPAIREDRPAPEYYPPPSWLELDAGMTPIQMRSAIAARGIEGDKRYSSEEATKFWKNLLSLGRGDTNFYLLPVEEQYAKNVLGISPQGTESLLDAILRG